MFGYYLVTESVRGFNLYRREDRSDVDEPAVKVWRGSLFCQFCGRRLKDEMSMRRSAGPECLRKHKERQKAGRTFPEFAVILAIGNVPEDRNP